MTDQIRFQTGFRGAPTAEPGLVMHLDGSVWRVASDGSETPIGGSTAPFVASNGDFGTAVVVASDGETEVVAAFDDGIRVNGEVHATGDSSFDAHFAASHDAAIGSAPTDTLAFYGVTEVVQQVVPLTTPTVQDIIDALVAVGLIAQHD